MTDDRDPVDESTEQDHVAYEAGEPADPDAWETAYEEDVEYVGPAPAEDILGTEPASPARASPRAVLAALISVLVLSLVGNAILGVRYRDQRAELDRLRRQLGTIEPTASPGAPASLLQIASAVERIRGLTFKNVVRPEVLTPDQFRQRVRAEILAEVDEAELRASERVLEMLGVIPEGYDLIAEQLDIALEQVGGFYDNKKRKLVVPSADAANPSPLDRVTLAHEYTHALTDEHFDLDRLDRLQEEGKDDEALAFLSLVEGDAEAVRNRYMQDALSDDDKARLAQEAGAIETEKFLAAPKFLQDVLAFPYQQGVSFVQALIEDGGFGAVDAAYRDPPDSTEQILHPERYLGDRDDPVAVTMPAVGPSLGSGWGALDDGSIGELDLQLVGQYGGQGLPAQDARAAAGGWDGGAYVAFERGDHVTVAMLTVWDSEAEAREAATAFARWVPLRFRNVGTAFAVPGGSGFAGAEGAGSVARSGDRVLILLGPDRQTVENARKAFSGF